MDNTAAWSAECREALAGVAASTAVLGAIIGPGVDPVLQPGADLLSGADPLQCSDPLRDLADACLDGLAEVARLEARAAALKVRLTAD
ncbi:hypothetical protein NicSoilB4_02660 [Arthrobacter sp. NicSoilB4]|nr:hypothetical protein NicSoilB4_02660 [Arthrobacter sp. NicSoilB4]